MILQDRTFELKQISAIKKSHKRIKSTCVISELEFKSIMVEHY